MEIPMEQHDYMVGLWLFKTCSFSSDLSGGLIHAALVAPLMMYIYLTSSQCTWKVIATVESPDDMFTLPVYSKSLCLQYFNRSRQRQMFSCTFAMHSKNRRICLRLVYPERVHVKTTKSMDQNKVA